MPTYDIWPARRRPGQPGYLEHPDHTTPADAPDDAPHEPRTWEPENLQAALHRFQERSAWALTHGDRPLPAIDSDGHVIVPPETLAKQAAWAAEVEAERLAGLTPGRLDAVQTRRWVGWLREFDLHRPTYLRLSIGPRGEWQARQLLAPYEWSDDDERHPDGGRVAVRGVGLADAPPIKDCPRAYPSERVLDAIRQQWLTASWLPEESNKPTPPTPLTIDERLQAMADERDARAKAKREPGYNYRLIIEGGRGW